MTVKGDQPMESPNKLFMDIQGSWSQTSCNLNKGPQSHNNISKPLSFAELNFLDLTNFLFPNKMEFQDQDLIPSSMFSLSGFSPEIH